MKRLALFVVVVAMAAAGLWLAERRRANAEVSPDSFLHLIGDTQHELTRLPASATRLSDSEEIRFGQELARRADAYFRNGADRSDPGRDAVQQSINRVGGLLAAHAHRRLPYSFHYIPDPHFANAFALPGGSVYIGAGLISLMDSDDELASVLGHEIEHIDHYHCAERVQIEARTRQLGPARLVVEIPLAVFAAGYTKEEELQADAEGTRLAVAAGYSPLGSIRMFEAFERAYHDAAARTAASPQEEVANVALQTLQGYFRSHPPSSERADRIRALMEAEHWPAARERDLEVGWVFWQEDARRLLREHKYAEAEAQSNRTLQVKPGFMDALWTLSRAQMKQAEFAAAAATLRRMLDAEPHSASLTSAYAEALAGMTNHARAAREFQEWIAAGHAGNDPLGVNAAGLRLLAGDERDAHRLASTFRRPDTAQAALIASLGWWYYLAARYDSAAQLLADAQQLLPADRSVALRLGWASIERKRYADALASMRSATTSPDVRLAGLHTVDEDDVSADVGLAVALWLGGERKPAVARFTQAYDHFPEWRNPRWVRATYSPAVWRTVSQIAADIERSRPRTSTQRAVGK